MRRLFCTYIIAHILMHVSASSPINIFSNDSLYMILKEDLALTDIGIGYDKSTKVEDEVFNDKIDNSPVLRKKTDASHAQFWQVHTLNDSTFMLQNFKTKRYIWSNLVTPHNGKSWKQASEEKDWKWLPNNIAINKLNMGPSPQDVQLFGICNIKAYHTTADNVISNESNWISISDDAINSSIVIKQIVDSTKATWTTTPMYKLGSDEIPIDQGENTSLDLKTNDEEFKICGNDIILKSPHSIYNILGLCIYNNKKGTISLKPNTYIIRSSSGHSHKIIIR